MKLAEYQDLYYVKKVDFGVYLAEDMGGETHVLLPSKQVPEDAKPGEKIRVFLYKDSKDRLIATTNTPKLTLGEEVTGDLRYYNAMLAHRPYRSWK